MRVCELCVCVRVHVRVRVRVRVRVHSHVSVHVFVCYLRTYYPHTPGMYVGSYVKALPAAVIFL